MIRNFTLALLLCFLSQLTAQTPDAGKRLFQARCSSCHADDGTGGGHGPNIVDVRRPRATTPAALRDLIRSGIPGAGMPAFPLPDSELDALATYVLSLKPSPDAVPAGSVPAGDATAGERYFNGVGNCGTCHMV